MMSIELYGIKHCRRNMRHWMRLKHWSAIIQAVSGRKVVIIRSESGGDFTSNEMEVYFKCKFDTSQADSALSMRNWNGMTELYWKLHKRYYTSWISSIIRIIISRFGWISFVYNNTVVDRPLNLKRKNQVTFSLSKNTLKSVNYLIWSFVSFTLVFRFLIRHNCII